MIFVFVVLVIFGLNHKGYLSEQNGLKGTLYIVSTCDDLANDLDLRQ